MEKLAVAGDVVHAVDIEAPIEDNLAIIAGARRKRPDDITVAILDRPRHADLVKRVLSTGARIKFLLDGDVGGAILAADEGSTVDVLVGIGGTPEGVIAACAMKCLDGAIFGKLYPRNDEERQAALDAGYDLDQRADHRRPRLGQRRLLRRHRGDRRRAAARRALHPAARAHAVAVDAFEVRRDPRHRRAATTPSAPTSSGRAG